MKSRLIVFLSLFIIFSNTSGIAQCPDGLETITLDGQVEVDQFLSNNPSCMFIEELEISGDVTDLSGFASLSTLNYLYINGCSQLTSLDGFSNVRSITHNLGFYNENGFTNLCGLTQLEFIGGDLKLESTSNIESLVGLKSLSYVDEIYIDSNADLKDLYGLEELLQIAGDLIILNNPKLTICCGIQNLLLSQLVFGSINISNNPSECSSQEEIENASCMADTPLCASSTKTLSEQNIFVKVFPNPSFNRLHVQVSNGAQIQELSIFNVAGEQILHKIAGDNIINIEGISTGMYFLNIRTKEGMMTKKILIKA